MSTKATACISDFNNRPALTYRFLVRFHCYDANYTGNSCVTTIDFDATDTSVSTTAAIRTAVKDEINNNGGTVGILDTIQVWGLTVL